MDFKNKKILIVAAHPDDEILGCGGTIHRLVNEFQAHVKVVILGEGITSRDVERDLEKRDEELSEHRNCITSAKEIIGYHELSIYQFADNRFDSFDLLDLIKVIESEKKLFQPDWVLTHHFGDLNIDHRRTFEAVLTAFRPLPGEKKCGIACFETFSSTEWSYNLDSSGFRPNFHISLNENNLKAKLEAMKQYKFETRPSPHPRSALSLEYFAKAAGSKIGYHLAENFHLVRVIL